MKKQIWLRPDESELMTTCLLFTRDQLRSERGTTTQGSSAHWQASTLVIHRIEEIVQKFSTERNSK